MKLLIPYERKRALFYVFIHPQCLFLRHRETFTGS
jgi:hypothetical protein